MRPPKPGERTTADRISAGETMICSCQLVYQPDYENVRRRHGIQAHSPMCHVGMWERRMGVMFGGSIVGDRG
jgi:hypothetical protein